MLSLSRYTMTAHAEVSAGDAGLPLATAAIGPVTVLVYQHRDALGQPLPVVVAEIDHPDDLEVRVRRNPTLGRQP